MFTALRNITLLGIFLLFQLLSFTQNSMVGDGFGGRLWYSPTNYTVGSYSGYSICYDDSSQLYGWGSNNTNQLGTGGLSVNLPIPIPNMTNVKYFSTGYNMGAIKNDNTGWIWGSFTTNPIQVITNAYFLDASSYNISFVKTDGTVWTMGTNSSGQYGNGNTITATPYATPTQMLNINNAVRVANNYKSTIVLLADSSLVSCGDNSTGNCGLDSTIITTSLPTPIIGLPPIVDIKSNAVSTIALAANGDVYFWGGGLLTGATYNPVQLTELSNIVAISGCDDGFHFMALDSNKNCYGWGGNWGQFGLSATTSASSPSFITGDVIDIMAGETFSYIVKSDYSLWASGSSNGGSIWLNLPATHSTDTFTQIDPSIVPEACPLVNTAIPTNTYEEEEIDSTGIIFPNVFSPNGDDENDNFYFPNWGVSDLKCEIYNRWGIKIYEWYDKNGFWDGRTTAGKECSEGTYYYIMSYRKESSENWERHKGFITLLR